ncbi:MAG: hypothetical protein DHS20C02_00490 [Micavibrio sp.]|nr:MAG: hypothetical protein DHS20C02_00490 [Micavibrio sp.]
MNKGVCRAERRKVAIGIITGLMKKLALLAPHPTRPGHTGPLFTQNSPNIKIPSEHDSMLGQVFMDALLTSTFSDVTATSPGNEIEHFDLNNIAESVSEYHKDRIQPETGEGKGSFALCKHRAIADGFNFNAATSFLRTTMIDAFRADLPRRMQIEKTLAFYDRRLLEPAIS